MTAYAPAKGYQRRSLMTRSLASRIHVGNAAESGQARTDVNDVVDGAHSAASECHRVVASKQTTLRGAVHGRG